MLDCCIGFDVISFFGVVNTCLFWCSVPSSLPSKTFSKLVMLARLIIGTDDLHRLPFFSILRTILSRLFMADILLVAVPCSCAVR